MGNLCCFQFLAILNGVTMNMVDQVSLIMYDDDDVSLGLVLSVSQIFFFFLLSFYADILKSGL